MARKARGEVTTPSNWAPSPNDAMAMAAFRWFANIIESHSIELYASSPRSYEHTEAILRETLDRLALLKLKVKQDFGVDDCPEGYRLCDGICKPDCDEQAPLDTGTGQYQSRPAKGGKPRKR